MKQITFYKYGMITMLLLNLCLIGFLVLNRPSNRQGPRGNRLGPPRSHAIEVFDMDENQLKLFKTSAQRHSMTMDSISKIQHTVMSEYLINPNTTTPQSSITQVENLATAKLAATNQHFEELKSILNDDQLTHYQPFIQGVMTNFFPTSKKRQRPPKDF